MTRSKVGALKERPRLDWLALRKVTKQLATKTPKLGVEHFVWATDDDSGAWEDARILAEGDIDDVPWPGLVWNCRQYQGQTDEEDEDEVLPKVPSKAADYVKVGYMYPKDRLRFRGVGCFEKLLGDLMGAAKKSDPSSVFVVFDTCGSVGDSMAAAMQCSLQQRASGKILQPGSMGCYCACVEVAERQCAILLDRRSKTFETLITEHGVLVDGVEVPLATTEGGQRANAARFSQECASQCEFLKVNRDFTALTVSLEQQAAAIGVEVDATMLRIFGAIREHFGEEGKSSFPRARRATPGVPAEGAQSGEKGRFRKGGGRRAPEAVDTALDENTESGAGAESEMDGPETGLFEDMDGEDFEEECSASPRDRMCTDEEADSPRASVVGVGGGHSEAERMASCTRKRLFSGSAGAASATPRNDATPATKQRRGCESGGRCESPGSVRPGVGLSQSGKEDSDNGAEGGARSAQTRKPLARREGGRSVARGGGILARTPPTKKQNCSEEVDQEFDANELTILPDEAFFRPGLQLAVGPTGSLMGRVGAAAGCDAQSFSGRVKPQLLVYFKGKVVQQGHQLLQSQVRSSRDPTRPFRMQVWVEIFVFMCRDCG